MSLKLQSTKKNNNNSEEGYKIQIVRCVFFKQKTDVKAEREETLAHKVTQQRRHRGKTQKKKFWKVYGSKEGWNSIAKGKEHYSTLCKDFRSTGTLLTLGQGHQGLKTLEMSKNSKNCNSNSTTMLSMMG